jgi:opacity protein-like surface antigen
MRKLFYLVFLIIAVASSSYAAPFGLGGYGGVHIPIIQEDQNSGAIFGLKAKVGLLPGIVLEPNINMAKFGEREYSFGTREGSKITSFGIDALLGGGLGAVGFKMYGILGGGYYSVRRDNDEDINRIGWSTGLGFEIGLTPSMGIDIRGKLNVISTEGGGSKKAAAVTGGLNYYFGL